MKFIEYLCKKQATKRLLDDIATRKMNSYKEHLHLEFLRDLCCERGTLRAFRKGELFVEQGEVCGEIGFIERGYFHYVQRGSAGEFITGFAFENEFVTDYPRCLYGLPSDVAIVAAGAAEVRVMDASVLTEFFAQSIENERIGRQIMEQIFLQTYSQLHELYTRSAEERYLSLLSRSPLIVQQITLKELASYLRVTPTTISAIRHRITFGEERNGK